MDVGTKVKNILCDGGSYKYNTNEENVKYFARDGIAQYGNEEIMIRSLKGPPVYLVELVAGNRCVAHETTLLHLQRFRELFHLPGKGYRTPTKDHQKEMT